MTPELKGWIGAADHGVVTDNRKIVRCERGLRASADDSGSSPGVGAPAR